MDISNILGEIKGFLEGYNNDLKYIVNVETDPRINIAECVIHEPGQKPRIERVKYEPFMYMKDLSKNGITLYENTDKTLAESKKIKYGITITKLKTGNQKRLVDGYCYKLTSRHSYNDILNYLTDGGINPFEKQLDDRGRWVRDAKGKIVYKHRDLFYAPRPTEQFFISTQTRLFKGFEEYKNIHKVTFDIETTGLRYQIARVFAIGVRDNRGFETILEVDKVNDDESEIKVIQDFFNLIDYLKPAIIAGYNSEEFDFDFILGRAKLLKMDIDELPTGLKEGYHLKRRANTSVKYGNTPDKYTATEMWGLSIIDIMHAAKRTAAVNSDLKEVKLKYLAKHEKVARPNRTYIDGEDNSIGRFYYENKMFLIDKVNNYIQVPDKHQETAKKLYKLQFNKNKLTVQQYNKLKTTYLDNDKGFVDWFKTEALPKELITFIGGRNLVKQYLLDDLWETEQIDELYNQSSFMIAKIVPTTYQRVCTMGTAGIWNLLMTAWSYENDLAIPHPDKYEHYSGGLARTYMTGFLERIIKIDYASLYPMIQLTEGVFPFFDITGVMKKILLYLTTTRNIYKKLANSTELNKEEVSLLRQIDPEVHIKYINKELTPADILMFKIKQLPIKILNNSLYGALGSNVSFNWSDNVCAMRITCVGRLHLRHGIHWFKGYGLVPLLAVTDGINFQYPEFTKIRITDEGVTHMETEGPVDEMWQYGGKTGVTALIEKYNKEEMKPPFMSVDDDGKSVSCLNLARINYATLALVKDKKTGEMKEKIKLTGNTIKSKVMSEYIEEFIDNGFKMILHGQGKEFVDYYYDYCDNIRYMQIPLKKIANKSKVKNTISAYLKRGKDKNGRDKGMQAHMELLIEQRNRIAEELFDKYKDELNLTRIKENYTIEEKLKLISNYMPAEPELDSTVYYVNTGYMKSHGDSRKITDKVTGLKRFCATLINTEDLQNNPNLTGEYNYRKYIAAFNSRVTSLFTGFDPEIRKKILVKIAKDGELKKEMFKSTDLQLKSFDLDDFDDSMYLESLEINFWNKTAYDPRLVWNGFREREESRIHYEIYDNALNYLNDLMTKNNKPRIKSINSDYKDGDLVLIKDGSKYHVGAYNGIYMQIIREDVDIPKSEYELKLDREREEQEKLLQNLKGSELTNENGVELSFEEKLKIKEKYFEEFKKKYKIESQHNMEFLFAEIPNLQDAFDRYLEDKDDVVDDDDGEYLGDDYGDGDSY